MFGELKYLYVGTSDVERDLRYYKEILGASVAWDLTGFGARVASVRLGRGPQILLADHRSAPSCMPVYVVDKLDDAVAELERRGWVKDQGPFEIPDGPCYTFRDPSGNPFAMFQNDRPDALLHERARGGETPKRPRTSAAVARRARRPPGG